MFLFLFSILNAIYLMCLVDRSISVPPEYCVHQPNTTDCGLTPKPMFYYYKPGSRCEIRIWRGCPTLNMFETEALCSHVCLFPFLRYAGEIPEDKDTCSKKLNDDKCTKQTMKVYTFDITSRTCVPATWRGCNTSNIFMYEDDCLTTCRASSPAKTTPDFDSKVKLIGPEVASQIANILNAITPARIKHKVSVDATEASEEAKDEKIIEKSVSKVTKLADVTTVPKDNKPTGKGEAATEILPKTASVKEATDTLPKTASMEAASTKSIAAPSTSSAAALTTVLPTEPNAKLETTTIESSYENEEPQEVLTP